MAQKGARANPTGISRGGRTTKIRALTDVLGRLLRLVLTLGNTSDVTGADPLIGETLGNAAGDRQPHQGCLAWAGHDADNPRGGATASAQLNVTNAATSIAG
jgi:hypothetical protein